MKYSNVVAGTRTYVVTRRYTPKNAGLNVQYCGHFSICPGAFSFWSLVRSDTASYKAESIYYNILQHQSPIRVIIITVKYRLPRGNNWFCGAAGISGWLPRCWLVSDESLFTIIISRVIIIILRYYYYYY